MVNPITSSGMGSAIIDKNVRTTGGFVDTLRSAISEVDTQQDDAQTRMANLLSGKGEDVHSAMLAVERAELSFQLMMQLRNKVVSAYQEIARMQF